MNRGAERRADHAGCDQRRDPPPTVVSGQFVEEVTAERRRGSLGEVDHPGGPIDQNDPLPEQRVEPARTKPDECELDEGAHLITATLSQLGGNV